MAEYQIFFKYRDWVKLFTKQEMIEKDKNKKMGRSETCKERNRERGRERKRNRK